MRGKLGNLDLEIGLLLTQFFKKIRRGARQTAAGSRTQGCGRCSVGICGLHQRVKRFFSHAIGFGRSEFLVQFVQFGSCNVLLLVDPQNLVFFLILDQFFLRGLNLHLKVHQLFRKPVGGLHRRLKPGFEILFDVSTDKRIYDMGS